MIFYQEREREKEYREEAGRFFFRFIILWSEQNMKEAYILRIPFRYHSMFQVYFSSAFRFFNQIQCLIVIQLGF